MIFLFLPHMYHVDYNLHVILNRSKVMLLIIVKKWEHTYTSLHKI